MPVAADPIARQKASPRDVVALCRPRHWLKNVFVLAPVVFGERLSDPAAVAAAAAGFGCFCLLASGVYALNDVADQAADRRHPRKRGRPVAAGRVRPGAAVGLAAGLTGAALAAALAALPPAFAGLMAAYLANTLMYSFWLKHKVIADVLSIAAGFFLRLLAGCVAVGLEPSSWLLICGFSLAMVLGFGKRRAEVESAGVSAGFRPALASYGRAKLDTLLAASTAVCLLTYMLYTVAPDTVARHGTAGLVYTVPIVTYGLFRYLFKAQEGTGDGPTEILVADPVFALTGLVWVSAVVLVLALR